MKPSDPKTFIKEKTEVEDSGLTRTWTAGPSAPPAGILVGSSAGHLFLVGPRGSGRTVLGRGLAERYGLPLVAIETAGDLPEADAEPAVAVVAPSVFRASAGILRSRGPVVFLMATPGLLMERMGERMEERLGPLDEAARRALAEESALDEPVYLSNAHFVLPAERSLEENLEDLVEKLALTGFGSGGGSRCPGSAG